MGVLGVALHVDGAGHLGIGAQPIVSVEHRSPMDIGMAEPAEVAEHVTDRCRFEAGGEYHGITKDLELLTVHPVHHPQTGRVVGLDDVEYLGATVDEQPSVPVDPFGVFASIQLVDEFRIDGRVVGAAVVGQDALTPGGLRREVVVDGTGIEDPIGVGAVIGRGVTVFGEEACTCASVS